MRPEALIFGYSQLLQGWTVMDRLSEIQAPTLVWQGVMTFCFRRNIRWACRWNTQRPPGDHRACRS